MASFKQLPLVGPRWKIMVAPDKSRQRRGPSRGNSPGPKRSQRRLQRGGRRANTDQTTPWDSMGDGGGKVRDAEGRRNKDAKEPVPPAP